MCKLLDTSGSIRVEDAAIEGRILLSASYVWCFSPYVQQYIVLICARESCVIEMSSDQGLSGGTGVRTHGRAVWHFDESQSLRKAKQ